MRSDCRDRLCCLTLALPQVSGMFCMQSFDYGYRGKNYEIHTIQSGVDRIAIIIGTLDALFPNNGGECLRACIECL